MTGTRFKPHPETKDSGIEWLGRIPTHWELRRLGSTVSSSQNGVWGDEGQADDDDMACVRVADFDRQRLVVCEPEDGFTIRNISASQRSGRVLERNDLLLEKSGGGEKQLVGAVVRFQFRVPAVCSNFVARIVLREGHDAGFLAYLHFALYAARVNLRSIKQSTGIQNLDEKQYFSEPATLPPLAEQQAIADFLDRETAKIDALVEKKERLIELLQEKRTALITHAVTKGLDPEVPMKDSGIEWLGQIPAHWEVVPLKKVSEIIDGDRSSEYPTIEDFVPDGIPFLSSKAIEGRRLNLDDSPMISTEKYLALGKGKLQPADIVMTVRGTIGNCALFTGDVCKTGFINAQMMIVRPNRKKVLPTYLLQQFYSRYFQELLSVMSFGAAQQQLTNSILSALPMHMPSLSEQVDIANFLDRETAKIDTLIAKVGEAIERLKEYRTALISAAVTGKIDVREEAA